VKTGSAHPELGKALCIETPWIVSMEEIMEKTGYPCGGGI